MPLYDFTCKSCEYHFETFAAVGVKEYECPECGETASKDIVAPAFQLKGDGFYSKGTFTNAHKGPKIDKEFSSLSNEEMNKELGLPDNYVDQLTKSYNSVISSMVNSKKDSGMFNKIPVYMKGEPGIYGGVTFEELGGGYCKGFALEKNLPYLKLVCGATVEAPEDAPKPKRKRRTKAEIEAAEAVVETLVSESDGD